MRQPDRTALATALKACFPGFEASSLRPANEQGADSDVWVADEEWILRRARRDEVREWYAKEAKLLPALAEVLAAAVPKFELVCLERGLVGYRMIRGKPLEHKLLQRLPQEVGAALGEFIAQLHGFDVADAAALGAPLNPLGVPGSYLPRFRHTKPLRAGATAEENGWRSAYADAKSEVSSGFAPEVSGEVVGAIDAVFDAVLEDATAFEFRPTLVHTELSSEHTLFYDDGRLAGVIDWSDACISDPAADIALSLTLPPLAAAALMDAYGAEPDAAFRNRVRVSQMVGAYLHLLHARAMRDATIKAEAVARLHALIA